jgi:Ca2+-binding RTX toxin-like protein
MSDQVAAFAGAEGYGAETVGGRGGQVLTVTNLNDSGVGSLRWALEDVSGPRTVVFAVSGTISLKDQILIENPNVTIAGQTAPGEGVTIEGARVRVKADEVIVRGLKFRPGDGDGGQDAGDRDGLFIGTTDFEINNVVIDHNSFTWAVDENLSINGRVHDVTISNNIIAQGLSHSIHPKGEHSKGLLVSNWEGAAGWDANISIVDNLFAGNTQRNPEVRAGQNIEIVNNLIYDYGLGRSAIAVGGGNSGTLATTVNVIGNVMIAGPDTDGSIKYGSIALSAMGAGSAIYLSDNLMSVRATDAAGNQVQTSLVYNTGGLTYVTSTAAFGSGLSILDSSQVASAVLANVGAINANGLDAVDAGIIAAVAAGQSVMVDSVAEAGGYMKTSNQAAAVDTDRDGMPNWFENLYGFNAKVADNNGDSDHDGYTNVEEYINGLITGFDLPLASTVRAVKLLSGKAESVAIGADAFAAPLVIGNFNAAEGDRVDVSQLMSSLTTGGLTPTVDFRQVGGDTIISIDRDGSGTAYDMQAVAMIRGQAIVVNNAPASSVGQIDNVVSAPQAPVTPVAPPAPPPAIRVLNGDANANTLNGDTRIDYLYGLAGNDTLNGGAGDDHLFGGVGKDKLDGGVGADELVGGLDDDTYIVDNVGDTIVELAGEGTADSVQASVSYTLAGEVENLTLTGAAALDGTGNALANKLIGNAAANHLYGLDGNDTLSGGAGDDILEGGAGADKLDGGIGVDRMLGGLGDDSYTVDDTRDVIVELAGGGVDTVTASATYTLAAEVDNLTLSGTAALDGTGNELANKITGNAAANHLYGLDGNDTLAGGAGDDILEGGAGVDKLDGGLGIDRLLGGLGDDSYVIDDARDVIVELVGSGTDSVSASASYALSANVENLTLTGAVAIDGTGNELVNKITGNAAANHLYGMAGDDILSAGLGDDVLVGGLGRDQMTGGDGRDTFVFGLGDASIDGLRLDMILDFQTGQDRIQIGAGLGPIGAQDLESAWMNGNTYATALAKAGTMLSGHANVAYVAGTTDGWLFWDDPNTAAGIDGAVAIKGGGAASLLAFSSGHDLNYTDLLF